MVITLIADRRRRATTGSVGAFATPTVVHFSGALLISALVSAPWGSLAALSIVLAVGGFGGLIYGGLVIRRTRRSASC